MLSRLIGTRKNLVEFAKEESISVEEIDISEIEECSDCSIWLYKEKLVTDLDGNPICSLCKEFYGL